METFSKILCLLICLFVFTACQLDTTPYQMDMAVEAEAGETPVAGTLAGTEAGIEAGVTAGTVAGAEAGTEAGAEAGPEPPENHRNGRCSQQTASDCSGTQRSVRFGRKV